MRQGPLTGLKVIEFAGIGPGPFCGMLLSDLGADVVRIDRKGGRGGAPSVITARGRRSVALDLKSPAAIETCLKLMEKADAIIEGFRPGVMERLGLDWPTLREANPRLVVGSITGYGAASIMADAPAIDGVVQAFSGAFGLPQVYDLPAGPVPMTIADLAAGAITAQGVLAALFTRERTGIGARIEVSLVGALLPWLLASDWVGSLKWPGTVVAEGSDGLPFVVQTPSHFRARLAAIVGVEFTPTDDYGNAVRKTMASRRSKHMLIL